MRPAQTIAERTREQRGRNLPTPRTAGRAPSAPPRTDDGDPEMHGEMIDLDNWRRGPRW